MVDVRATLTSARITCCRASFRMPAVGRPKTWPFASLQGRGVGGSTVHNTNLCKRTPEPILELWGRMGVVGADAQAMRPSFEAIERDLGVSEIPADMRNANNDALRQGCEALGWRGAPMWHNRVGCQQSGFCELGCAYDAKQNALKVVLPQALDAGAEIYSSVEATRVVHDGRRVQGVHGVARDTSGIERARVAVWAPIVVLAASAVGSAALARRSGVPDPHGRLGRGLRMHPGAVVAGRFDRTIAGWRGIPQSYECTEHLSFDPGSDRRVWIIPAFAHPVGAAASLPGFGAGHMAAMRNYPNLAVLTAMVHDETSGQVLAGDDGRPILRLRDERERTSASSPRDWPRRARLAPRLPAAREVTIPCGSPQRRVASLRRARRLLDLSFVRPHAVPLTAVHPMGTMRMGEDPRSAVVRSTGEHHPAARPLRRRRLALPDEHRRPPADQHLRVRPAPSPRYIARRRARGQTPEHRSADLWPAERRIRVIVLVPVVVVVVVVARVRGRRGRSFGGACASRCSGTSS